MSANRAIRVAIADDHAIVRAGLKQILSGTDDITLAGEASTGEEAIKMVRKGVDVLLLDISLPDCNGIDVLKQIRKTVPKLSVLMLSMHREDMYAIRSIRAGAAGYLNKRSAPEQLVEAIRHVAGGNKYVSPTLAQELVDQIGGHREIAPHETLSDREYQTLVMIASGKAVSDIAAELSLSAKTISMYRTRLLAKMKLRHNAELTHYAIKNGLVE